MRFSTLLFVGFLGRNLASIVNHVVHEKRDAPEHQAQWQKLGTLPPDTIVPVRLAIKQPNLYKGMDLLMEISDPRSKSYGKHYKPEEVVELFAPDDESFETVKKWLISAGISGKSIAIPSSKGWVYFDATVAQLEFILGTKYYRYEYIPSGEKFFGTDMYHLPPDVSDVVDFIIPAVAMAHHVASSDEPTKRRRNTLKRALPSSVDAKPGGGICDFNAITIACIMALYNVPNGTLHHPNNSIGIYEPGADMVSQSDLTQFYKLYTPRVPQGWAPEVDGIDGANVTLTPVIASGEADLDAMMIIPIVYPQRAKMYQTQTQTLLGLFNQFLDAIDGTYCNYSAFGETGDDPEIDGNTPHEQCGVFKPAAVISSSYSYGENHYPASYSERQCNEFMKLSLQGTTFVYASGDSGVQGDTCLGANGEIYNPDEYSSCPYVLSVGGSGLPFDSQPGGIQVSSRVFPSGSGFSNIHLVPGYQKDAIASYFKYHDPKIPFYTTKNGVIPQTGGSFNRNGRGFPDIAAIGDNGITILNGIPRNNWGTSMSAPIVAGILSRINGERLEAGKSIIGFVNPVFYSHPEMFHDITVQANMFNGSTCNTRGFSVVKGWDPVTGLGTPNYPAMLKVFMNLP